MKVSVALCTYNGSQYLSKQLNSIARQTICVDEIVICDDSSSDGTDKEIEYFIQKIPPFCNQESNPPTLHLYCRQCFGMSI